MASTFTITHPFHPQSGQRFTIVSSRWVMGVEWIHFHSGDGRLRSIRADWTDLCAPDLFVSVSGDRAHFRPRDLLELVELIGNLRNKGKRAGEG